MPKILSIHRVSDKPYDYSMGLFYTIMPNGLPDPLPEQLEFMCAGTNMGAFKTVEDAKEAMIKDIVNNEFGESICNGYSDDFYKEHQEEIEKTYDNYYIISELIEEDNDNDIFYANSDPPNYDKECYYIVENGQFVKKID